MSSFFSQLIHQDTYKTIPTELPNYLARSSKSFRRKSGTKKEIVENFVRKLFLWGVEFSFDKHANSFWPKVQTFLTHHPKKKKKSFFKFFSKWFLWTLTRQFRQSCPQIISYIFEKLPSKIRKIKHWQNCSNLLPQFFPVKDRMQFCQTCRYFFAEIQKLSTKNPKAKHKLLAFLKPFDFLEWLVWPRTMQFRQTSPKISARIWKKIRSSSKKIW